MQEENLVGSPRKVKGGVPQKYILDDRGRKLIYDLYDGSKERTALLERQLGIPRKIVQRFAMKMGKTRPRGYWPPEDEEFLRKNLRKMSMKELTRHLHRDKVTIIRKANRMGLYRENDEDGYTLADIMLGFGVSTNRRIYEWIEKGWLKGKKIIVAFQLERWNFQPKDIRAFILNHPNQINQHKFDWPWIADILAGDRGIGRLDDEKYAERKRKGEE